MRTISESDIVKTNLKNISALSKAPAPTSSFHPLFY